MNSNTAFRDRLLLVALGVFAFLLAFHDLINADYWFHLRGGAEAISGRIPRLDSFSYPSAGRPYIDLHWLFQVALYGLHRLGGVALAVTVKSVLVAVLFMLVYQLARREASPGTALPIVLLAAVMASERFLVRPEILSFLLLAILLTLLRPDRQATTRLPWTVPLLFLVWANTEGIFVVGLGVLGAFCLDAPRERRRWLTLLLSLVAVCVNPYGLEGALHPFVLFTRISGELDVYSSTIGEFLGPFDRSALHPAAWVFPFWLALLALGLALFRRPRLGEIVIVMAFVFLSFKARRNLALLAIATAPILARWLAAALAQPPVAGLWARLSVGYQRRARIIAVGLFGAAALAYLGAIVSGRIYTAIESNRAFGAGIAELACPEAAAEFLKRTDAPGPVFSDLSTGSYLIWADPRRPVFIDGRLEVHETDHYARYLQILGGGEAWADADAEFGFQTVLLDHGAARTLTGQLLRTPEWVLCHVDGQAIVLVRRNEGNADYLGRHALAPSAVESIAPPIAGPGELNVRATPGLLARTLGFGTMPWTEMGLGQIFAQAGVQARAAEQYRRAVERAPLLATPRVLLAGALNQLGRPLEAESVLAGAAPLLRGRAEASRLFATQGDVFLALGRHGEALAAYDRWLDGEDRTEENAVGRVNRAVALQGVGRLDEAAAAVRSAIADLPQYIEAYRILGEIEDRRGDTAAAREAFRTYLDGGGTAASAATAWQRLSGTGAGNSAGAPMGEDPQTSTAPGEESANPSTR